MKKIFSSLLIFLLFFNSTSFAQTSKTIIRDAQTEKFLYDLARPLIQAANLNENEIKIHIIQDNSINAFVTLGQNMFINTGLITKYQTPNALIGVIAHEMGHIKAGHIARSSEDANEINKMVLLSYLLGIGASLAGNVDAGQAIIFGGSQTYQKLLAKYSRTQEEAADRIALQLLDKISYPANGLLTLLQSFKQEQVGLTDQIDEYSLSHPISQKRIDFIEANFKNYSDITINQKLQSEMNVILLKLNAFIIDPNKTIKKYQNQNNFAANYSKSIAYYRLGQIPQAVSYIDKIIKNNNNDGFLYELKAQFLFDGGKVDESIINYDKAIKLLPTKDSAQAKISSAAAIISTVKQDKDLLNLAIKYLNEAQIFEEANSIIFKLLSSAYSKINESGKAYLALAEFNLLKEDNEKTRKYAKLAKENLKKSDKKELLRADDILQIAKNDKKEKQDRNNKIN